MVLSTLVGIGLYGCDSHEDPCPSKGWVSDKCAPFGEFRYGDKVLRIPNTEPNKYRWHGGVTYVPENKSWHSPNLGFYWKSGKAAGRASGDWPVSKQDLVLFGLVYFTANPTKTSPMVGRWRPLVKSAEMPKLPFAMPLGLSLYTDKIENLRPGPKDQLFLVNESESVVITCPSIEWLESPASKEPWCTGMYYVQPGLRVDFSMRLDALNEWEAAIAALSNLINSWETKNAQQPTAH